MKTHVYRSVTGSCPTTDREETIEIEYTKIPILGTTNKSYKAFDFKCEKRDNCQKNSCPIYLANITFDN